MRLNHKTRDSKLTDGMHFPILTDLTPAHHLLLPDATANHIATQIVVVAACCICKEENCLNSPFHSQNIKLIYTCATVIYYAWKYPSLIGCYRQLISTTRQFFLG